jgi:hypothetical protein
MLDKLKEKKNKSLLGQVLNQGYITYSQHQEVYQYPTEAMVEEYLWYRVY